MENFTIHIFGYGETQIISKDLSVKVLNDSLSTSKPLIDLIWNKRPKDSEATEKYHAINIFNYNDVRYICKKGFNVNNDLDLKPLIINLIAELETKKPAKEVTE